MTYQIVAVALSVLLLGGVRAVSEDGQIHVRKQTTNTVVQVEGDGDDDWRIQTSSNLGMWTTLTNFGTILSGTATNAPWRSVNTSDPQEFFRAFKTAGL